MKQGWFVVNASRDVQHLKILFLVTFIFSAEDSAIQILCMLASALSLTLSQLPCFLRLSHFVVQADWEPRIHLLSIPEFWLL